MKKRPNAPPCLFVKNTKPAIVGMMVSPNKK